jgi:hypothetical protein
LAVEAGEVLEVDEFEAGAEVDAVVVGGAGLFTYHGGEELDGHVGGEDAFFDFEEAVFGEDVGEAFTDVACFANAHQIAVDVFHLIGGLYAPGEGKGLGDDCLILQQDIAEMVQDVEWERDRQAWVFFWPLRQRGRGGRRSN